MHTPASRIACWCSCIAVAGLLVVAGPSKTRWLQADTGHSSPGVVLSDDEETLSDSPEPAEEELNDDLAEVRVEGNSTIATSEIARFIKSRPGRPVLQKQIREDVDALVKTRWFTTVEPFLKRTDAGNILVFRVTERPIVHDVKYVGNKKINTNKLEAITNLKVNSPYDVAANRECARRLEDHYHEKGFTYATVQLDRGDSRDDRDVVFRIYEGPKVHVVGATFNGNQLASDPLLRTKLRSKIRLLGLFGGKYDPTSKDDDVAALKQYYLSLGYFDVQIEATEVASEDRAKVTLQFDIEEGPRYKIRGIELAGNRIYAEDELRQDFKTTAGEYYNASDINRDVEKIREMYGSLGRMFAKVDAVPRFSEDPGVVDLVYRIDEDKVYRVRKINVHMVGDHPHTRNKLPLNIARIHPGDLADPKKINQSKSRLDGSSVFERGPENGVKVEINRVEDVAWFRTPDDDIVRGQFDPKNTAKTPVPVAPKVEPQAVGGHSRATLKPPPAVGTTPHKATPTKATSPKSVDRRNTGYFVPQEDSNAYMASRPRYLQPPPSLESGDAVEVLFQDEPDPWGQPMVVAVQRPRENTVRGQSPIPDTPTPYDGAYSPDRRFDRSIRDGDPSLWQDMPAPEFIDIDAYLTEARTGRLMLGVGVNSNSGLVGNIVLQEQNFNILRPPTSWDDLWNGTAWRGAGQQFRIEAVPGSQVSRYVVDWQDPYFLDTDVNLGVSGFYYQRFLEYWAERRLGGRVRVGRQFTPNWSGSLALRLEDVNINNAVSFGPQILNDVLGSNFLSTARASIIHDTRDAAFLPSEGHRVEMSYEQAFGDFSYSRLEAEGSQYFTTFRRPDGYGKHIVLLHGNLGWTSNNTPVFERFFAGGYQSFRGFRFRGVSPVDSDVRVGGLFQATGTLEYSLPVTASEALRVVAFTDFGTVDEDVSLDSFRVAVGGGLRITIPALGPVPVALDWALPIVREDSDRRQYFSFYLGVNY